MTFIFRSDSAEFIGSGHIRRCLNIAKEIQERGSDSIFICNPYKGNINNEIKKNFKVLELPKMKISLKEKEFYKNNNNQLYKDWLGCNEEEDAINSLNLILKVKNIIIDWIIVDHYSLGEIWEKTIKNGLKNFNKNSKILVIDDLFNRKHYCEILLNQNYFTNINVEKYKNILGINSHLLLGPHYALLGKDYFGINNLNKKRKGIKRILIYFGGVENSIHYKVIESICEEKFSEIIFDYIISKSSKYYSYLKNIENNVENIYVHDIQETLADFILRSDLFIGAGGSTSLERLCLGIPSITIVLADNQKEISENLNNDKYINLIGNESSISHKIITKAIDDFINKKCVLKDGKELVDGYGTKRVVNNLLGINFPIKLSNKDFNDNFDKTKFRNDILNLKLSQTNHNKIYKSLSNDNSEIDNINLKIIFYKFIFDDSSNPIGKLMFLINKSNNLFSRLIFDNYSDDSQKQLFLKLIPLIFQSLRENVNLKNFGYIKLCHSNFYLLEKLLYPHSIEKNLNKKIKFITILSDENSWLNEYIPYLITKLWFEEYEVRWIHNLNDFKKGDICLILSFSKSIQKQKLLFNKKNIVVYENDLQKDKGFSSISLKILEVKNKIINSLNEIDLSFHSSQIYNPESINLNKNELVDDWQKLKARKIILLCMEWIKNYPDKTSFNIK
tara:strand:- start:7177 stop:9201 length:2025 start_codon:yes stop_codon:yes gene_type:complete